MYVGQTNDLEKRVHEHVEKLQKSAKYIHDSSDSFKLVYRELFETRKDSMNREKQIKGWSRAKKLALIKNNIPKLVALSHQ